MFNAAPTNAPLAFDYKITNLVRTQPVGEAAAISLPHVMELGPVRMTVSKVTEQFYEPEIEAAFMEGFVPAFTWKIQEAYAVDRHGNFLRPSSMCREEKSSRVVGRAQRLKPESSSVPFEFGVARTMGVR